MKWRWTVAAGALALVGLAAPAFADEASDTKAELEAMKRQIEAQKAQIERLEGTGMTKDEVSVAVDQYMARTPASAYLCADSGGGSAGFPLGKKPYIKEGPNKIEFAFREQVRYEAFLYSKKAVGTSIVGGNPVLDPLAPRDRSGWEIGRLYIGLEGEVFCPEITFKLELGFQSNTATTIERNYAYLDWKYSGENHIRAGSDKAPYCLEENTSSAAQAFVDRGLVTKAFEVGFNTSVALWGYWGSCECPKQFMYKVQVGNGEGRINQEGQVYSGDALNTYSDQPLIAGFFEWTLTCEEWKWDELDHRPCDKRCRLNASIGVGAYHENDDDKKLFSPGGLAVRSTGPLERTGFDAWFRAQWNGWSLETEFLYRDIKYTAGSAAKEQADSGIDAVLHYRFGESNWGLGARFGMIWLDKDYLSTTVGGTPVAFKDTITEFGFALNYFFWDNNHKVTLDVDWVQNNSGVSSSKPGYVVSPAKGVVIEDGVMLRLQWQLSL